MGARRNYFSARQLESAGLLQYLVCDAAWASEKVPWWARTAAVLSSKLSGKVRRRTVADIPSSRLRSSWLVHATLLLKPFLSLERLYSVQNEILGIRAPIPTASDGTVVFSCFGNGGGFLDRAKARGAKVITEFPSHPDYWDTVREERARWPGWGEDEASAEDAEVYRSRIAHLLRLSDIYLCPSEAVAEGLSCIPGFVAGRVRVVPYGASGFALMSSQPDPGRVLFAASKVTVTKGLPYLAEAARVLRSCQPAIRILVAGEVAPGLQERCGSSNLIFLGPLSSESMAEELARADIFCLPSLSEGSPSVVFEALANGVPVVTTQSSGSVVQNGREGLIVPERSGEALAEAIARIFEDRPLRDRMSSAARETSARYSDEACGEAFLDVVRELLR